MLKVLVDSFRLPPDMVALGYTFELADGTTDLHIHITTQAVSDMIRLADPTWFVVETSFVDGCISQVPYETVCEAVRAFCPA